MGIPSQKGKRYGFEAFRDMKKAIVLLSGGLDSTTALYVAQSQGFDEIYALTFVYGQKHERELESAKAVAKAAGVKEHKVVNLLLNQWDGCSLTDPKMEVADGNLERKDIPDTYVPARNMVFLSVAASWADALGITDIFIGVSEVDYSGYVDCREEFIQAMEKAIKAVEDNIENPQFSVEELSSIVGMSRSNLYNKLMSITGKAPSEFIRLLRLKKSVKYLQGTQMTVAEVAYKVGFNSPKIFTHYFKEEYKMTPTEYRKAKETQEEAS